MKCKKCKQDMAEHGYDCTYRGLCPTCVCEEYELLQAIVKEAIDCTEGSEQADGPEELHDMLEECQGILCKSRQGRPRHGKAGGVEISTCKIRIAERRREVILYLEDYGPMHCSEIWRELEIPRGSIYNILRCDLFRQLDDSRWEIEH